MFLRPQCKRNNTTPVVIIAHSTEVNQFYKTLLYNVQSLKTLGKIRRVVGMARSVLEKLKVIKGDLIKGHEDWQGWDLPHLVIALMRDDVTNFRLNMEVRLGGE